MKLDYLGEFRVLTLRETATGLDATGAEQIADYWRQHIANDVRHNPDVETLFVICLSTRRKILGHSLVASGLLDTLLTHPREVFRPAIVAAASAIVLVHNHPSGDHSPSEADVKVTRDLVKAGQLLKIELLDHVIMGTAADGRGKDYMSLRELGYFYS